MCHQAHQILFNVIFNRFFIFEVERILITCVLVCVPDLNCHEDKKVHLISSRPEIVFSKRFGRGFTAEIWYLPRTFQKYNAQFWKESSLWTVEIWTFFFLFCIKSVCVLKSKTGSIKHQLKQSLRWEWDWNKIQMQASFKSSFRSSQGHNAPFAWRATVSMIGDT